MANLVIGREEDGNEISLEFKTSASRERFRKMMNEDVQLDEGSTIEFKFDNPMKAGAFMRRIMQTKLASEVDRYDEIEVPKKLFKSIMHPNDYERNDIEKVGKGTAIGQLHEDVQLDEGRMQMPPRNYLTIQRNFLPSNSIA